LKEDIEKMEITYRAGKKEDFESIFNLCERRFGEGYISRDEYMSQWVLEENYFVVAECDGDFCGYSIMVPSSFEEIADHLHMTVEEISECSKGKPAFRYRSAAMEEKYEGKGIMKKMNEMSMEYVKNQGCSQIFVPAWKYGDYIPMDKLFSSLGFEIIAEKERIWENIEGYTCVVCHGKCICPCVIYRKIL